jgi:hypothetical protein
MKKIKTIGIIYRITFVLVCIAACFELFIAVGTGAIAQTPWIFLLFLVLFVGGVFGIIVASAILAYKPWSWGWVVSFTSIGLLTSIPSLFFNFSILSIIGILFGIFVLYSFISEKDLFFPLQPDSSGQLTKPSRTLIIPSIVWFALLVIGGAGYLAEVYYYQNHILPATNNIHVQTAITTTLAEALVYSLQHNGSYLGYQATPQSILPKCGSPLTVNVSSNGGGVAVFGKSCTDPNTYYCEALPLSQMQMGNTAYNQSMPTIPAQFVSATKYECSPASTSPAIAAPAPIIQTQSANTLPSFGPLTDAQLKTLTADFISDYKAFYAAKGTYTGACIKNSFNATDTQIAVADQAPIGGSCDTNAISEGFKLSNGTYWCQDTTGFAGVIKYPIAGSICSQSDAFHEKYGIY